MGVRLYIAGTSRECLPDGSGRLDGILTPRDGVDEAHRVRILESYKYVKPWQTEAIGRFKGFMLDSGAFTFMAKGVGGVDLDSYLDGYAEYVSENDVGLFFELDVDDVIGVERTRGYRDRLERLVGRRCVPVWHECRGRDAWSEMCDEYDYVAIGGIADKGRKNLEGVVPEMVAEAHERGAMVHGLGYAKVSKLERMGFDSVDSASWTWGVRGHFQYAWDGARMHYDGFVIGERIDRTWLTRHNFMEWVRMAEDLERADGPRR